MEFNKNNIGIYISRWNAIGGVERFVQNFCIRMAKHCNITLLYESVENQDLFKTVPKSINIIQFNKKTAYTFDIFICATAWGTSPYRNIEAKASIQIVHANYAVLIDGWNFKYKPHPKTTHHICVGEDVKQSFESFTGLKCDKIIYNLLDNTIKPEKKPKNKILTLVTCSRLSGEKGFKRMLQLCEHLEGYDYVWNVYGNTANAYAQNIVKSFAKYANVIFKGITREPFKEINKADYLVQLSDTEGFAYSVYEAMQVKTPCIITPFASGNEQITNGVNGYIVPFEMDKINIEEIIKKSLIVPEFQEKGKESDWLDFFNECINWHNENTIAVRITAVVQVYKIDQIVYLPKERALSALERGLCELV